MRRFALAHPGAAASLFFLVLALPTTFLPLFARDFYHLERARNYVPSRFWEADDFEFKEYFWWPFDGFYCRFFRPLWSAGVVLMDSLFGLSVLPHRILWMGLHLLSIALFAAVLRRSTLSCRTGLVALGIYVAHPFWCSFALEPIAVGSANALVMALLFAALLSFMAWRDGAWRLGWWAALAACVTLLFTKEIGVIAAPMLLAFDALVPSTRRAAPSFGGLIRRHAAWCGLTAIYLVFYLAVVARPNHLRPPYYLTWASEGFGTRMLHQIGLYLAHPLVVGVYHPLANAEMYMRHPGWFALFIGAAILGYAIILRRTWRIPWARFAAVFLALSILPVLPVIVQFQEFAPAAAAVGILLALAIEQGSKRRRTLLEAGALGFYTLGLIGTLVVSAAMAEEGVAAEAELDRVLPAIAPGTQLYFVNTPEYMWLGEASELRLRLRRPDLNVQHLSFDCGDVPPNPRTPLGQLATAILEYGAPELVATCDPLLVRTSSRSFVMTLPGRAFFDSDLGRFVLQGREAFRESETMRHGELEARVDRVLGEYPAQISFRFDKPLDAPEYLFIHWQGTRARLLEWNEP